MWLRGQESISINCVITNDQQSVGAERLVRERNVLLLMRYCRERKMRLWGMVTHYP